MQPVINGPTIQWGGGNMSTSEKRHFLLNNIRLIWRLDLWWEGDGNGDNESPL